MGFLKRLFSFSCKKYKKRPPVSQDVDCKVGDAEEEHEEAVCRLLRSSSSCYKVVSEVDYATLPPLPHPINQFIQHPSASTSSLASTVASQRGKYTVTVYGRRREYPHTNTDYHNNSSASQCNISAPALTENSSHSLGLRSDPSIASLLDMYDEHGKLAPDAFTSSPPFQRQQDCLQTYRSGSTLRQLLGNPSSVDSIGAPEGDISWAERFLSENADASSTSTLELSVPSTPSCNSNSCSSVKHDLSTISDFSPEMRDNPAILSLEVEVSIEDSPLSTDMCNYTISTTPKRASQVFEFLSDNRRSKYSADPDPLPDDL